MRENSEILTGVFFQNPYYGNSIWIFVEILWKSNYVHTN